MEIEIWMGSILKFFQQVLLGSFRVVTFAKCASSPDFRN